MFEVTVQKLKDVSVVHCKGRMVVGKAYSILCATLLSQKHIRTLVVDLAQVTRIDAGGLGVLLSMRARARAGSISLKLMNAPKNVGEILELTGLRQVFEFCSVQEMLCLLHRAAFVDSRSVQQSYAADTEDSPDPAVAVQEAVPLYGGSGLTLPYVPRESLSLECVHGDSLTRSAGETDARSKKSLL